MSISFAVGPVARRPEPRPLFTTTPVLRGAPHVVLIGPMGCGKTTVGGLVAVRLDRPFLDNDQQLLNETGMTAQMIEQDYGTAELHRLELEVFGRSVAGTTPSVISVAASVLDTDPEAALAGHLVVYLRCSVPVSISRSLSGRHRPTVRTTADALAERDRCAVELADLIIDTDALTPPAVADQITLIDLTSSPTRTP